jgi:hypothetical protein
MGCTAAVTSGRGEYPSAVLIETAIYSYPWTICVLNTAKSPRKIRTIPINIYRGLNHDLPAGIFALALAALLLNRLFAPLFVLFKGSRLLFALAFGLAFVFENHDVLFPLAPEEDVLDRGIISLNAGKFLEKLFEAVFTDLKALFAAVFTDSNTLLAASAAPEATPVATFDTVFIAAFTAPEDCDENIFSLDALSEAFL